MKVAYIAGPYRAPNARAIVENIRRAEEVALRYWNKGYAVICPHLNTALFDGAAPDETWLAGDIEIFSRCDVLIAMKGWHESEGAYKEVQHAITKGLKVIFDEIECWPYQRS